ncbi:hypothetical protein CGBL_0101400 [Corynebacterium glutamicum]|nr:hypothetical protein CGBL_0101400 [Corynebacterium glutamicum]
MEVVELPGLLRFPLALLGQVQNQPSGARSKESQNGHQPSSDRRVAALDIPVLVIMPAKQVRLNSMIAYTATWRS